MFKEEMGSEDKHHGKLEQSLIFRGRIGKNENSKVPNRVFK